jgi:hypothetical protein
LAFFTLIYYSDGELDKKAGQAPAKRSRCLCGAPLGRADGGAPRRFSGFSDEDEKGEVKTKNEYQ